MTATVTPGVLEGTWDVKCEAHEYDQRGLALNHALNASAKHNRENHAEPVLNLSEAARSFLHYTDQGSRSFLHYTDQGSRSVWRALTGMDDADALAYAEALAAAPEDVTAHVAPF